MKFDRPYPTIESRPGIADEMLAHVQSGDPEMARAAAAVVFSVMPLETILTSAELDPGDRMFLCKAEYGSRIDAVLHDLESDQSANEPVRHAAREMLQALQNEATLVRGAAAPSDQLLRAVSNRPSETPLEELLRESAEPSQTDNHEQAASVISKRKRLWPPWGRGR